MRFRFELKGDLYSKHKDAFKQILAKHGLRWQGTLERPLWAGTTERVVAIFERDPDRDRLVRASLVWEGRRKSPLLEDLKAWAWQVGASVSEEKGRAADEVVADVEKALDLWDVVHKPNVERLREQGRPKAWIEEDVRRWKRQRQELRRQLIGRTRA